MFKVGIDVGSTFTKYCIADNNDIVEVFAEKTPVCQLTYFSDKVAQIKSKYNQPRIVSCGYGRKNTNAFYNINELSALALGANYIFHDAATVLDIGGQDTKIIYQENGHIKRFFVNDKCAAGSGMFLLNICRMMGFDFTDIDLTGQKEPDIKLSSICAVFAQTEIITLLSENVPPEDIISATIWQILIQSRQLLNKVGSSDIILSGGLTQLRGFSDFAQMALGCNCTIPTYSFYLSAIGCCLYSMTDI